MTTKTTKKATPKRSKVPVTIDDITVNVYADIRDDFRFFKLMVEADEDSLKAEKDAIEYLFGDDLAKVESALEKKHGVVRTKDVAAVFYGVLGELAKNFSGS